MTDLRPFGWAPGGYMCRCSDCKCPHYGADKRSIRCKPCAEIEAAKPQPEPTSVPRTILTALSDDELAMIIVALRKDAVNLENAATGDQYTALSEGGARMAALAKRLDALAGRLGMLR